MRVLLSISLGVSLALATQLTVKDGGATISQNGKEIELESGKSISLEECQEIKKIKGEGKVKIEDTILRADKVYRTECKKGVFAYVADGAKSILASGEVSKSGATHRALDSTCSSLNMAIYSCHSNIVDKIILPCNQTTSLALSIQNGNQPEESIIVKAPIAIPTAILKDKSKILLEDSNGKIGTISIELEPSLCKGNTKQEVLKNLDSESAMQLPIVLGLKYDLQK